MCSSSSSPSIIGPRSQHRVEIPPPLAICPPAALPVAPFSPCSILSTRTEPAEIPSEVGLPGPVWRITWLLQSWAEDKALWKIQMGWGGECEMAPEAKQLIELLEGFMADELVLLDVLNPALSCLGWETATLLHASEYFRDDGRAA